MNKTNLLMKTLLLCLCILGSVSAWAVDVTVSPMFNNANVGTIDAGIFTITGDNMDGTNFKYASKTYQIAKNKSGTITVASTKTGCYIKSITFTDTGSKISTISTSTDGATASLSSYTATITANDGQSLESITFTASASGGTTKIGAMTVVVDNQSGDDIEAMYTFTGKSDGGVITCTHSPSTLVTLGGDASNSSNRISWGNNKTFTVSSATKYLKAIYWQDYSANPVAQDKMTVTSGSYSVDNGILKGTWVPTASTQSVTFTQVSGSTRYLCHVIAVMKAVSSQSMTGVKVGSAALTENASTNGYTVSGTTLTLTSDQAVIAAPTNIKLIKHVLFSDASYDDIDVDVTFGDTPSEGYYSGTATVNEIEYTVKVPVNTTPTLELTETSGSLTLKSYDAPKSITTTLRGSNLTNGTLTAPSVTGITISPASVEISDGSLEQEFTITTTSTTAASTDITFEYDDLSATYTLSFTKPAKRSLSRINISEATTWDWKYATTNTGNSTDDVLLTKVGTDGYTVATDPARDEEFLLATLPEINNDETFNSQALLVTGQYMRRWISPEWAFQGSKIIFTTTVPGTVSVTFSNTGNKDTRYLYINGENTGVSSDGGHPTNVAKADVPAGDVTIEVYTNATTPVATLGRIAKIVFTPCETVTVASSGWTSLASVLPLDFANAEDASSNKDLKAYVISNITSSAVTLTSVESAPAETGLILKGTASTAYTIPVSESPETISTNELSAAVEDTAVATESVYVVSGGELKLFTGVEIPAGKAYLEAEKVPTGARGLSFVFDDGETTGISNIEDAQRQLLSGDFFNLAGQRVAAPAKGLYIVNGKKVVVK